MKHSYYVVKNLYDYEEIIPPPTNLPSGLTTVYITNSPYTAEFAEQCGWDIVKLITLPYTEDKFARRKRVADINCFPALYAPEVKDGEMVFVCDSNIVRLWDGYVDFINSYNGDKPLAVTSGYYKGKRDNIWRECEVSCNVDRWKYNHKAIREATDGYINEILNMNVGDRENDPSIVSAKYIGWNIHHPNYGEIANILYDEYSKHLQGNIILTYMSEIYKEYIHNYYTNDYSGGKLNEHKYSA